MIVLVFSRFLDINLNRTKTKFCLTLNYISDNGYLFVAGKEIYKFKGTLMQIWKSPYMFVFI